MARSIIRPAKRANLLSCPGLGGEIQTPARGARLPSFSQESRRIRAKLPLFDPKSNWDTSDFNGLGENIKIPHCRAVRLLPTAYF